MNADRHFAKGEEFERSQTKLDAASDVALIVEACYFAGHHFIMAGADWQGATHSPSHPHGQNFALLKQAGAPQPVVGAWRALEKARSGNVYGGKTNGTTSADVRMALATLKAWVVAARP